MTTTPLASIHTLRKQLAADFPERKEVIDGAILALLAGEHVFFLGPPGTAKSALARAAAQAFQATYAERLLTKFTTPEEVFGPLSVTALTQDRYLRITKGALPEAHIAFVDEVFKANSAILNSLLALMNERTYFNDGANVPCPLITLFGASNELPEGQELEANFDRFLLRYQVSYVIRPASFRAILRSPAPTASVTLTLDDLRAAQAAAAAVKLTDSTVDRLIEIRDRCRAEGIIASDRRWKKMLAVVKASAWLAGETATCPEDLLVLTHALWRDPKERTKVAETVGQIADPVSSKANALLDAARDTAARLAAIADRKAYITQAATAIDELNAQEAQLAALATDAGPRAKEAVAEATQEIQLLSAEVGRRVATAMKVRG